MLRAAGHREPVLAPAIGDRPDDLIGGEVGAAGWAPAPEMAANSASVAAIGRTIRMALLPSFNKRRARGRSTRLAVTSAAGGRTRARAAAAGATGGAARDRRRGSGGPA
jgi:hypothetical protein